VDPATVSRAVLAQVHALDPDLPAYDVATMEARLHDALARRRLAMGLLAAFAGFALMLSGIGTYGIIAYWVSRRRREIGIRMALGADRAHVLRLVGRELVAMVGVGLVVGIVGALALSRLMRGMLFGVAPTDVPTFLAIPLIMLAVAVLAAYLPARRAVRVEPSTALRYE
ncbi:MAG TPA: FtsX-like permease family protein, partial [Gemmatimonadales bacterium]|nr:FtsX-like permease family protein [Gemmatimonadales bacterium]